jgi:hypothetical protein
LGNSARSAQAKERERLRRKLFTLLAAISLLLCVATAALWVRSVSVHDEIIRERTAKNSWKLLTVASNRGVLRVRFNEFVFRNGSSVLSADTITWKRSADASTHEGGGLSGFTNGGVVKGAQAARWVTVPHWFVVAILGVLPVLWFAERRRTAHRRASNRCTVCGYDLRATPERCPECGAFPASSTSSTSSGQASSGQASSGQAAKANA